MPCGDNVRKIHIGAFGVCAFIVKRGSGVPDVMCLLIGLAVLVEFW